MVANAYLAAIKAARPKSGSAGDASSGGGRSMPTKAPPQVRRVERRPAGKRVRRNSYRPAATGSRPSMQKDGLACVTLSGEQWRALIAPLVSSGDPAVRVMLRAIESACQGRSGSVELWQSGAAFTALLSAVLQVGGKRFDPAMQQCNAVAAVVTAQVFGTMK